MATSFMTLTSDRSLAESGQNNYQESGGNRLAFSRFVYLSWAGGLCDEQGTLLSDDNGEILTE